MKIEGGFTVQNSEEFLNSLARNRNDHELLLPTNAKTAHIGGEASIAQVIITWAASRMPARLLLHASDSTDPQIRKLVALAHGMVAALCCDEAMTSKTRQSIRDVLLNESLQRLALLQGPDPKEGARGLAMQVFCADHFDKGSPAVFYRGVGATAQIRTENEFQTVAVKRLIEPALPPNWHASFQFSELKYLGSLIYELFKNTDEHAKSDVYGNVLRRSIRGVMIRHHFLNPALLTQLLEGLPVLSNYAERIRPPREGATNLQFVELSVFDSGPGFAPRLRRQQLSEMSVAEEYKAVTDCFQKNISSKSASHSGVGLPYVVDLLKRHKGFLRIRTGRLSLYHIPSWDTHQNTSFTLYDASGSNNIRQLSAVQGTLVSIIIPLGAQ